MLLTNGTSALSGTANEQIGTTFYSSQTLHGTLGTPDPVTRRMTVTTNAAVTADQPTHYAAYVVDASHLFLLSTDPHNSKILLSGVGKRQ